MLPSDSAQTRKRVIALIRLYESADTRLQGMVNEALVSGTVAKLRYRRRVLAQVRELLASLRSEGATEANAVVLSAYDDGLRISQPDTGRRALTGVLSSGPHKQAVEVLVNSLDSNLKAAETTVGRRIDDIFRREQLRVVAERLATGDTQKESAKALETALRRHGTTAFVDRAGRQWSLKNYAAMATRTVSRETMSTATKNRMLERGLDLIEIDKHPHEADACSPYDGGTFSLTGATPGYPVIDKLPPFHPQCKHTAFPSARNFDQALRAA